MAGPNVIEILIRARDEATSQLQAAAGSLGGFSSLVGRLGAGLGPVAVGLTVFAAGMAAASAGARALSDEVERLNNLSSQTGVSVGNLQTLQQLLKEAGGTSEDASQAINFLNRAIATGDPLLKKLGITTRDTWQAFNQLVQILAASKDASARTEVAFQLLGRGSAVLLGKIDQLAETLPTARSEMEKLGVVMSDNTIHSAQELDAKLDALDRRWKGMTNNIRAFFIPALVALADALSGPGTQESILSKSEDRLKFEAADAQKRLSAALSSGDAQAVDYYRGRIDELNRALGRVGETLQKVKTAPFAAALETSLGALGVHLSEQQLDVVVKPHVVVDKKDPNLRGAIDSLTHVDLTAAQKEVAELERLFGLTAQRARELQKEIHAADDQMKRLQIRDALIKIGVDFDKEQVDRGLRDIGVRLSDAQLKAALGVEPDTAALDAALKQFGVKLNAADLHAAVRAAGDEASLNAVLLAFGAKLNASQLQVVVKAVREDQEPLQPKGIKERSTPPPPPPISQPIPFDFDKARKAQQDLIAQAPKLRAAFASVAEGWRSAVEDMLTQMAIANSAFSALYNGLQAGFQQVAAGLLAQGQTLRSAMKTIFRALVNEVLAELARIAAAAVFKFLIGFLGGGPVGVIGGATTGIASAAAGGTIEALPFRAKEHGPDVNVAAPVVNVAVEAPAPADVSVAAPVVRVAPVVSVAAPVVNVPAPTAIVAAPVVRVAPAVNVAAPIVNVASAAAAPAPVIRVAPAAAPALNLAVAAPSVSVAAASIPRPNVAVNVPAANVAAPAVSVAAPIIPRPAFSFALPDLKLPSLSLPRPDLSGLVGAFSASFARLQSSFVGASRALAPPSLGLAARLAPAPAFAFPSARPVAGFSAARNDSAELANLLREQNTMLREQRLFGAASAGNTYQINALDARSVTLDLLAPSGSLRRANDVLAQIAEVA